jgi:hypothetical protein
VKDADADGSGSIDFTEFVELMIKAGDCRDRILIPHIIEKLDLFIIGLCQQNYLVKGVKNPMLLSLRTICAIVERDLTEVY